MTSAKANQLTCSVYLNDYGLLKMPSFVDPSTQPVSRYVDTEGMR